MSNRARFEDVFPEEVRLKQEEGMVYITWSDDHTSPFPLAYIRGWCPCARCQGHFTSEVRYQTGASTELVNAEPVGNYGMKLTWSDGHDTGIYAFDELRAMCPCPVCDPAQERRDERVRPRWTATS